MKTHTTPHGDVFANEMDPATWSLRNRVRPTPIRHLQVTTNAIITVSGIAAAMLIVATIIIYLSLPLL